MVEEARAIARWIASSMPVGEADLRLHWPLYQWNAGGGEEPTSSTILSTWSDMGLLPRFALSLAQPLPTRERASGLLLLLFPSGVVPPDPNLLPLGERESARVLAAASR